MSTQTKQDRWLQSDFNRASCRYDRHASLQRRVASNLMRRIEGTISTQLEPSLPILDIGAGPGVLSRLLPTTQKVLALDIAYGMCTQAKVHPNTCPLQANMSALPIANGTIPLALSSMALQWSKDPTQTLKQIHQALSPRAHFYAAFPIEGTLGELDQGLAHLGQEGRKMPFHSALDWQSAAKQAGFTHISLQIQKIRCTYHSINELLGSLRGVGGSNKHLARTHPFTRKALKTLETFYHTHFSVQNNEEEPHANIFASWHILYMHTQKRDMS